MSLSKKKKTTMKFYQLLSSTVLGFGKLQNVFAGEQNSINMQLGFLLDDGPKPSIFEQNLGLLSKG